MRTMAIVYLACIYPLSIGSGILMIGTPAARKPIHAVIALGLTACELASWFLLGFWQ